MSRIAYFGHDASDATIAKRVRAFKRDGHEVQGFMMRRDDETIRAWENIDLGKTRDAAFVHRWASVRQAVRQIIADPAKLMNCDIIIARNPDMLLCAVSVCKKLNLNLPVIYECLDVHHLMTRGDIIGWAARKLEKRLLRHVDLIVTSSPAFVSEYFSPYHPQAKIYLLENRLLGTKTLPAREKIQHRTADRLRIGWFGVLRCIRSYELLRLVAEQFPSDVEIILHGKIAQTAVGDLAASIKDIPNMTYHGAYKAPDNLEKIYASVDLVWAGDFFQAGHNSEWLLPNRLYEGGYFTVPALAPASSQTGQWVDTHQTGFIAIEPLELSLPMLIKALLENRNLIEAKRAVLQSLPLDVFIEPEGTMSDIIELALTNFSQRPD